MKRSLAIVLSLLMVLGLGAGFALADSEVEQINGEAILYAGQNIRVGMVNVTNDNDNIYVKFQLNSDEWCITETHVHVGKSLEDFPRTRPGNPIPGHFEYFGQHDCENQEDITYTIPLGNWKVGNEILIAAHAVVEKEEFEGDRVNETAWGAGKRFVNRGNWATYFVYTIVAPPPPDKGEGEVRTETA